MSADVKPFGPVDRALLTLLEQRIPLLTGAPARSGGELPGDVDMLYVRIARVPGGATNQRYGDFVFDVEVFSPDWNLADSVAQDIEAVLIGYPQVVGLNDQVFIFDEVRQNQGVSEIFWDDDTVHRLLATYVIIMRRR